jgi:hypothetical protein
MRRRRRRRGTTTVEPPRWSTPRVRPRLLLEHADVDVREPLADALTGRGYDVVTCAGPDQRLTCPVLAGRPCYALDDADAVVTGLAFDDHGRAIVEHVVRTRPELPLVIEGTAAMLPDLDPTLLDRAVHPLTADTVVAALPALERR